MADISPESTLLPIDATAADPSAISGISSGDASGDASSAASSDRSAVAANPPPRPVYPLGAAVKCEENLRRDLALVGQMIRMKTLEVEALQAVCNQRFNEALHSLNVIASPSEQWTLNVETGDIVRTA